MTHKLIHTPNYLLVVDDSEIKEGDWCLDDCNVEFKVIEKGHAGLLRSTGVTFVEAACKKIIAHLPLNDSPILEGVDLLPPLEQEDDVERLIKIEQEASYKQGKGTISWYEQEKRKEYYNKAKEKYKYTEEDIRKAIDMAQEQERVTYTEDYRHTFNADEIIQSLSQPKMPVGFERKETIVLTNQGQIVWVGKYIY